MSKSPRSQWSLGLVFKRWFDFCLSGAGLVVSIPLWGIIASAIKLEDHGPVFYPQRRVGKDGRVFACLKFRSMVVNSGATGEAVPTSASDPRVTRVGQILRATAMDELPQLWNILRGDMSFVGPRPEWAELVVKFRKEVAGFDRRHVLRPGLTGLAQVYGHAEMGRSKKLRYDLFYIKRRSFCLDLRLIGTSFVVTFLGQWEYRGPKLWRGLQPWALKRRGAPCPESPGDRPRNAGVAFEGVFGHNRPNDDPSGETFRRTAHGQR